MQQLEIVHAARASLGESPAWDAKNRTLYWVDILQKRLYFHQDKQNRFVQLDTMPGCVAPCKDGALIFAHRTSEGHNCFARFDTTTARASTLAVVEQPANNRFNDGKCDPRGRFLAGTMDMNEQQASGALYSLDGAQVTRLLDGIRISNGLAWSPDLSTLYYIDTPTRQVKAFDYDLSSGRLDNPRVAIHVPEALGWPDGMTSDTQGNLWIAMWGGAQVTRWDPRTGQLLEQILLPALQVSSCVFGGKDLDELYITSACTGLQEADLKSYEHSGSLFRLKTRAEGMPTFEFG
jgi:sugar lactone lactonase YvrE